jgi:hypothetical protein
MIYQTLFRAIIIGFATTTTSLAFSVGICPEYIFEPEPTYALGACAHPSSNASLSVALPIQCDSIHVSIPFPICYKNNHRLLQSNLLNIQIVDLKDPEGHTLVDNLYSAGFVPVHQVPQKTLEDQGLFDPNIVNEHTDIIVNINTPELNATYGWSGLPGQELVVTDNISSIQFGCNGYGPYEVYIVSCPAGDSDLVWCLIGLADRGSRRNLLGDVVDYLTTPYSLFGMGTNIVLEGARRLLQEHSSFTKDTR